MELRIASLSCICALMLFGLSTCSLDDEKNLQNAKDVFQKCMKELNISEPEGVKYTQSEISELPECGKKFLRCLYESLGYMQNGNMAEEMPNGFDVKCKKQYTAMRKECQPKVEAAEDVDKGAVYHKCISSSGARGIKCA